MLADNSRKILKLKAVVRDHMLKASTSQLNLKFGPNRWRELPEKGFAYSMHCEYKDFSADLIMKSLKPPLLVGGTGRIKEGLLGYSYYYAHTRLKVEGTLEIEGEKTLVTGQGWIDRQWGIWDWSGLGGWDWYSIQLNNNTDILVYRIFHPLSGSVIMQALNQVDRRGEVNTTESFRVRCKAEWESSRTKVKYTSGWTLMMPTMVLDIEPYFVDQECEMGFWEGSCQVHGSYEGREVKGTAYVEQVDPWVSIGRRRRVFYLGLGVINYPLQKISKRRHLSLWRTFGLG